MLGRADDWVHRRVWRQGTGTADLVPRPARDVLHLLGLDHKKLTDRFNGRDMRLTDVYGTLIRKS